MGFSASALHRRLQEHGNSEEHNIIRGFLQGGVIEGMLCRSAEVPKVLAVACGRKGTG